VAAAHLHELERLGAVAGQLADLLDQGPAWRAAAWASMAASAAWSAAICDDQKASSSSS
jgi:hypothetical protein